MQLNDIVYVGYYSQFTDFCKYGMQPFQRFVAILLHSMYMLY